MKRKLAILLCILFLIPLTSCNKSYTSEIPTDIEIANNATSADRMILQNLQQVEEEATIIVEVVAKEIIGQKVSTFYDHEFQKELAGPGFTKRESEITKVYKGSVETGDTVVLLQDYYIWTFTDESSTERQQLITYSYLKPAEKGKSYIMFLSYDDRHGAYWPVCDFQGMFSIPTDNIKSKLDAGTLKQSELDVYEDLEETLPYLMPIFSEVVEKYYS